MIQDVGFCVAHVHSKNPVIVAGALKLMDTPFMENAQLQYVAKIKDSNIAAYAPTCRVNSCTPILIWIKNMEIIHPEQE